MPRIEDEVRRERETEREYDAQRRKPGWWLAISDAKMVMAPTRAGLVLAVADQMKNERNVRVVAPRAEPVRA